MCLSPESQLSMRPLDWGRFLGALQARGVDSLPRLTARSHTGPSGHRSATVRVRVGQAAFRSHLLSTLGATCALTGPAPAGALEGAHLYSYAVSGVHHEHGGLLLRRDIHRLFDEGLLAVEPRTLTIDVAERLRAYPQYASLHGTHLAVEVRAGHREWLQRHWNTYRKGGPICGMRTESSVGE